MASRKTRLGITSLVALALVAGAALGVRALWTAAKTHFRADTCTIGTYELEPAQASVAATMVGAVTSYRVTLPERATVLALGAALQESKLTNLAPGDGDRDSVGVLQQRPSQDWGKIDGQPDTIAQRTSRLTNVGEATKEFLDHLRKIPNWPTLPLAEAVQAVQISADGSAYAQHEPEAKALADALQGTKAAGISCRFATPTKVATPAQTAAQLREQLGITTPTAAGKTVRVPGARWQTVAWFIANADQLGIEQVSYNRKVWTRSGGWKSSSASEAVVVATMYARPG